MSLEEIIRVGRGDRPADLLIRNARVIDVLSGEIVSTDVALHAGRVAGFGHYEAQASMDLEGRYLAPGFIDGHIHVESTMLTPPEFARAVVSRGTTAIVCDPHEIANVLGIEGISYMLRASAGLPVTIYVMLPSCVPATHMETSGAELTSGDLALLLPRKRVIGIAEMMNYPGVIAGDREVLNKIRIAGHRRVDGHAPGLTGKDLCAYVDAGIHSDHECVTADEAREKLRLGMYIMIREGTTEKNLKELIKVVTPQNSRQFMFVTDDKHPEDLIELGHIDHLVRMAIAEGVEPMTAMQMATINTAAYFGLKDVGAVAPGFRADFAVIDDLEKVTVSRVIKDGQVVADAGRALHFKSESPARGIRGTVNIDNDSIVDLSVKAEGKLLRVIGIVPGQITTEKLLVEPKVVEGLVVADPERDILKIAVVERHTASGNVGLGFVSGMGLKRGAIASSVAHDSHNVIVVGVSDTDMRTAVIEIAKMNGGAVVVADGRLVASLPLPVAGLMSDQPIKDVAAAVREVVGAAAELGCQLPDPLISLSFLALPVVPSLKLTDMGLVDVERFELVGLWED
ncbi:MAG: adenine deaminase [Thermoleophilia bacterium]|nr:adenine deaminase [Thermoleophilia bacterium]